jgi:RHS repeat-associated protein
VFNQRNQLLASPDGASYRYDGEGLRVGLTTPSAAQRFTWDRLTGIPLLLADGTNAYIYGPSGAPLEQISSTNTTSYLHHDRLGSIRALTSPTGQILATRTYDPYGNVTKTTGSYSTPFGYAGEYTDANTGLIYLRARYYQPSSGQFINLDPAVSQTKTPYLYANGDPVNATDPSGLFQSCLIASCPDLLGAATAAAGTAGSIIGGFSLAFVGSVGILLGFVGFLGIMAFGATPAGIRDECAHGACNTSAPAPSGSTQAASSSLSTGTFTASNGGRRTRRANTAAAQAAAAHAKEVAETCEPDVGGGGGNGGGGQPPSASDIFKDNGELTDWAIDNAEIITPGAKLRNPNVISELTADGSDISDWAKYRVRGSIESPSGRWQTHFYKHKTGVVNYSVDYKMKLIGPG